MAGKEDRHLERRAFRALVTPSNRTAALQLGGHLLLLVLTGTVVLAAGGTLWQLPAMALHGAVLVFLFAPLHETIHRTAFASRWLNDLVAWPAGLAIVLPPTWFRAFHLAHHRHTQDPARDPELAAPRPATVPAWLLHVSGLPYWRARVVTTFRQAAGHVDDAFVPARDRRQVVREARSYLVVYAATGTLAALAGSSLPLTLWLVPALLGQPFLRLYLLAEHAGCPLVPDMLANTRTTLTNRLLRGLAWNMPYHAEHHAYPAIPFHRLPDAHALLRSDLGVIGDGYLKVNREIFATLNTDPPASQQA